MLTSIARAALPPLVAVVTLPIILGRVSLSDYGLWATITGLIAVLATIDGGLATDITRRVAAARGADDDVGAGLQRLLHELRALVLRRHQHAGVRRRHRRAGHRHRPGARHCWPLSFTSHRCPL